MSLTLVYRCDDCDQKIVKNADEPRSLSTPSGWWAWGENGQFRHTCDQCIQQDVMTRRSVCQDCGMRHESSDVAACIEGHGDDPVHGVNCPIAQTSDPMSCTCDDEPVPYRGQIGTGF